MDTRTTREISRRFTGLFVLAAMSTVPTSALAAHPTSPHGARSGGVLEKSHAYHQQGRHAPLSTVPRYSYGFPVPSYKWGWFGATHYYPRTTSHRGYNGDYWQWAYRRGY